MNGNRNKNLQQRNITPNFLRFKRNTLLTQASPKESQKRRDWKAILQIEATPKEEEPALRYAKKECCTSVNSVKIILWQKTR